MQYYSSFFSAVPASGSPEQHQTSSAPLTEARSRLSGSAVDLGRAASQRAAIAKAYGDILLNGGHFSC